jgi:hypothetical protein
MKDFLDIIFENDIDSISGYIEKNGRCNEETEKLILEVSNVTFIFKYAMSIKSRWIKAENIIKLYPNYWKMYLSHLNTTKSIRKILMKGSIYE